MCATLSSTTYLDSIKAESSTGNCPFDYPVPCSRFTSPENTICVASEEMKADSCPITDVKLVNTDQFDSFVIQNPLYKEAEMSGKLTES